jgi:AraC family transcriptional regulator
MSVRQPLAIDYVDWQKLLSNPPLLTSFQSDWSNIQLAHYCQPSLDLPEVSNPQHMVILPVGHQTIDMEYVIDGRLQTVSYREKDFATGCIDFLPANLPHRFLASSTARSIEWVHCYIDPKFVETIAYESVNPDRVELLPIIKKADLLSQQISLALKSNLAVDGVGSRFYADSMATALSAHLLRNYATRKHCFREYEDGLSQQKLKQAVDYIQDHLGEDLSLNAIANELGMSQYYFCHLFKQSTGMSPHQYLIRQRVEKAKQLLKQREQAIAAIAMACGFANQSHFAKCFRQYTGMNPKQFRNL